MKKIALGSTGDYTIITDRTDTAAASGNPGVEVVSTATLITCLEGAAHNCIEDYFDAGEGSVGTMVNVEHLAAIKTGSEIKAHAVLTKKTKRRYEFSVSASCGELLLMEGIHHRVVVELESFLARLV